MIESQHILDQLHSKKVQYLWLMLVTVLYHVLQKNINGKCYKDLLTQET